jgi:cyclophilin family peptidyl-prolyl cis-trans isomerase
MRNREAAVTGILAAAALAGTTVAEAAIVARIDIKGRYYRAGEPVEVRLTLENDGSEPVPNPDGIPLLPGLRIEVGGGTVAATGEIPPFDPATQPRLLAPGAGIQQVLDLAPYFEALRKPGTCKLRFEAAGIASEPVVIDLAPPYDPGLDYQATLKTDYGEMRFDLLEDRAPDHVMNFVDLARRDFYDDTLFTVIVRGEFVLAGDRAGDGSGGPGYSLPPEISTLPHERGTLSSVRPQGGLDNGSQFFIDLRRDPSRDGNFSIFGRMSSGEEALAALEAIATTGRNYQPFFKPLQDTYLRDVVIEARPRGAAPEAAPAPEAPGPR